MARAVRLLFRALPLVLCAAPAFAADSLYLDLTAHGERMGLGLAPFSSTRSKADEAETAKAIHAIVKKDLLFPRIFNLIEGGPAPVKGRIKFDGWDNLNVDALVVGALNTGWFGRSEFVGELHDVASKQIILTRKYVSEPGQEREIAHQWANEIIKYFTGAPGVTQSHIVFVNDATGKKELYRIDYDGSNLVRLTQDKSINLLPKLSPDGQSVAYTTYKSGTPQIHVLRLDGKPGHAVCKYEGLNSAAAWMPDGKSLVATLSMGKDPNLYLVNLQGEVQRVLTNSSSADTAPSLSPDGMHIAFTSDRPGFPQIYVMDTSGANLKRMTRSGQCDSPSWSPQGDLIAYAKSEFDGKFDIYTIDVVTGAERRLTYSEGDNENPSWSPDGRSIVFSSTRRGRPELWVMGQDGSNPQLLAEIKGKSSMPHWGP